MSGLEISNQGNLKTKNNKLHIGSQETFSQLPIVQLIEAAFAWYPVAQDTVA